MESNNRVESNTNSNATGKKYDGGKSRWDLLPFHHIESIVDVLSTGALKYGDNNWQQLENGVERYFAALMRHLTAWRRGEVTDKESGLSHLAHCATNVIFLMELTQNINNPSNLGKSGEGDDSVSNPTTNNG